MKATKIIITVLLLFVSFPLFAQHDLSESDKEAIQARVKDKVEEFVYYLSSIVNTDLTNGQRQAAIKSALVLFIGQGERYRVTNEYGETENRAAVRMQLSSVSHDFKRWLPMKTYLQNQYNNIHRYGKVVIESVDFVRVDNIYKVSDGHYEANAYFVQKYTAFRDRKQVYGDITGKKVKVYIDALEIPGGVIWDIKLGDIYVTSTKPNDD